MRVCNCRFGFGKYGKWHSALCGPIAIVLVSVITFGTGHASGSSVLIGAQVGVDWSYLVGGEEDPVYYFSKSGPIGGIVVRYQATDRAALQTGLIMTSQGARMNLVTAYAPFYYESSQISTFHFLELPILLHYNFKSQGSVNPSVFFGPSIAKPLDDGKIKTVAFEYYFRDPEELRRYESESHYSVSPNIVFIINAGAGLDFKTEHGVFSIETQFSWGLTNLKSYASLKNRVISLTMSYLFRL